ncbi:MAG: zf-HC2 domain-containing protein [Chloroflexota bacterium]|nr:zf-HC2 domain-containing protein [Chloroflexota bacterium]
MRPVLWQAADHRFTQAHASEYVDGQLEHAGRQRIERHTSVCPTCRSLLAALRRLIEELASLSPVPRESVADSVLEHLRRSF